MRRRRIRAVCWIVWTLLAGCASFHGPESTTVDPAWRKPAAHLKRPWSDVEQRGELVVEGDEVSVSRVDCLIHALADLQFPEGNARLTFGMSPELAARCAGPEYRPWIGCLVVLPAGLPTEKHWRYQDQIADRAREVETAYWSLDKARAAVAWSEAMRDSAKRQLDNTRARRAVGAATDPDVAAKEAEWESWNQRVALARVGSANTPGLLQANLVLRAACAWPPDSTHTLRPADPSHELQLGPESWESDLATACRSKPDLLADRTPGLVFERPMIERTGAWRTLLENAARRTAAPEPNVIETVDAVRRGEERARIELYEVRRRVNTTLDVVRITERSLDTASRALQAVIDAKSERWADDDQVIEANKKVHQATYEHRIARDEHQIAIAEYEWRKGTGLISAGIVLYNEINAPAIVLDTTPIEMRFGPKSVEMEPIAAEPIAPPGAEPGETIPSGPTEPTVTPLSPPASEDTPTN